ncbi:MAG: hypothetical protein IPI83_14165 [Sphingomonadales bacterium]|nr:hypothetical protein [Sphingomonadales bacterium]
MVLSAPVLAYLGLAFGGHLITIDDDMPGEWSNPEGSKHVWRRSLAELLIKFLLFGMVGVYVAKQAG